MEKEVMHKIMFTTDKNVSIPKGKSFTIDVDGKRITITYLEEIFGETKRPISDTEKKRKKSPRDIVNSRIDNIQSFDRAELYDE